MSLTAASSAPLQREKVNSRIRRAVDVPYASEAQREYFNANRDKMEKQGVNVDEYNAASKGMKLPEHSRKKPGIGERILHGARKKMGKG